MTPVEVLAVMDWAIGFAEARSEDAAELREARAAIVALVAENDALRECLAQCLKDAEQMAAHAEAARAPLLKRIAELEAELDACIDRLAADAASAALSGAGEVVQSAAETKANLIDELHMKNTQLERGLDVALARIAELEAERVPASEPVAWVEQREPYLDSTPNPMHTLRWNHDVCPSCEDDLPVGTSLYAGAPPPQLVP